MASKPAQRDREAACAALDEQLAAGRLDIVEYADRYVRVAGATRPDELAAALDGQRSLRDRDGALPGTRRYRPRRRAALTAFRVVVTVAVVGLMFVYGAWWAMWLLVPLLVVGGDRYA